MNNVADSSAKETNSSSTESLSDAAGLAAKAAALPHGSSLHRGRFWRATHVLFWIGGVSLLIAALLRVVYHDGNHLLTWINAFTLYFYLPAYVCLVWAVCFRRWGLAVVALAVIAFHVAWLIPDFTRDRRFDVPASSVAAQPTSRTVRIFFANVLATNRDFGPLWREIERESPDVIVFAESSRYSVRSFRQTPEMASYVEANGWRKSQIGEVRVFSKLPILAESQEWAANRILHAVDIDVDGQPLHLVGLHAPRPQLTGYDYFGYWDEIVPWLLNRPHPLVIVGDFNATQYSSVYTELKAGGLRSAHDDQGRGYAVTWPNGQVPLPPIRIDQAFLSPDVECVDIREGQGDGSDHKPIIVDVRLREPSRPPVGGDRKGDASLKINHSGCLPKSRTKPHSCDGLS